MGYCFGKMTREELYDVFQRHPSICTDSRKIIEGSIFFALRGDCFDGNSFAREAIQKGCTYAVVDDPGVVMNERFLLVGNVLDSLQELAILHRQHVQVTVLAITGTNGKTTTKELCAAILSTQYHTVATRGNLNNHIGVPLTILSIHDDTDIAIVEMGASHPGEIRQLCQIAQPDLGLITNIGRAHLEGFGSFEGVISAKKELYDYIRDNGGTLFVNSDDELLESLSASVPRITYGTSGHASVRGACPLPDPYLTVRIFPEEAGQEMFVATQLTGRYNLENVLAAWAVGNYFHVRAGRMARAISDYVPANMRSQVINTTHNRVILDAYNANPSSMEAALRNFASLDGHDKWLILGDMLELGSFSSDEHGRIMALATELGLLKGILIGEQFSRTTVPDGFRTFPGVSEARSHLEMHPIRNGTVLVKGSRAIGLEWLTDLL